VDRLDVIDLKVFLPCRYLLRHRPSLVHEKHIHGYAK